MPDEFIIVDFPEARNVISNGIKIGMTNQVLIVPGGTHAFSLSDPQDYIPSSQCIAVTGTSLTDPRRIVFTPIPPAALPEVPNPE